MKKKLLLLLVAVVVLASLALVACGEVPPAMSFVAPGQTQYYVGDTLNLTGGKVVVYGETEQEVSLTTAMLDATTVPDFATAGTFTVKGNYQDFAFSFNITVNALPASTAFVSPAQTNYYVGDALNLAGASVTVGTTKYDLTADMLDAASYDMATAGNYTVTGTCQGVAFSFDITVNAILPQKAFVSPAKKVYALGEKLLLDGATVTIDGTTVEVTMDMLTQSTLPNFDVAGDYTVAGSYQGYDFSFAVKVYAPYQFKHDADFVFTRTADVSKHVWIKQTYPDGTSSDWYNVSNDDFSVLELSADKLHVEIDMYVNNYDYSYSADFAFDDVASISVSQLKQGTVGQSYYVNGILVAIATTSTRNEFVLADKVTGEVISVTDLAVSGATQAMTLDADVAVGDELIIPVTLTQAESTYTSGSDTWNTSDLGKLYGLYTGSKQLQTGIISRGNTAPISYQNATEITSQADLQNFLSATNRANNVYTMVHFKGEMGFVWYSKASQLRMYFAGGGINSYEKQKIDNISPVFCEGTQYYTTGKTFRELALAANYSTTSYQTNPGRFLDIYALFIGGNGYYHKFVVLKAEDVKPMEATITSQTFTAPTVTQYTIGSTLNLTGAKVTTSYDIKADEVVDVTLDMLDASTIPTFATAGTFTVKGSYNGYEFSFDVVVADKIIKSVTIEQMPSKATYNHRQGISDVDLAGGKLRVTYSNDEYEIVDMDATMLPATDTNWAIGTVNYTLTYFGQQVDLPITYQNTALTITQVLQNTPDVVYTYKTDGAQYVTPTNVYEVTGVVVRVITDYESPELLIREKGTNNVIGIKGDEATVGKYNAPALNTNVVNIGDEIALYVTLEKCAEDSKSIGQRGKVYLRAKESDFTKSSIVVLSKGNSTDLPLTDAGVTIIDSQEDLVAFINNPNRFYSYVKLVGINFVRSDGKNQNMMYKDSVSTEEGARINGIFARISQHNFSGLTKNTFDKHLSTVNGTYSSPATAKTDFYMLFVGGNSAAHHFIPLQDSWLLAK